MTMSHFLVRWLQAVFALLVASAIGYAQPAATGTAPATSILHVAAKRFSAPDSAYVSSGTTIAAGGIPSPIHQARVRITLDLPPGESDTVKISLVDGGAGTRHADAAWRWAPPAVNATLRMDGPGKANICRSGDAAPLSMTTTGTLQGTLTSSNAPGSTTVEVEVPARSLSATCVVAFGSIDLKLVCDPGLQVGVPVKVHVSALFEGQPVDGHFLKFSIAKVALNDDAEIARQPGLTEFASRDMACYVDAGGDGRVFYYLTRGDEAEHVVHMTQVHPNVNGVDFEVDDLTSPDPVPPATTPEARQLLDWPAFLHAWTTGDRQTAAASFAGDNGIAGGLTYAKALEKRGSPGDCRLILRTVPLRDKFPVLLSVTTFWNASARGSKTAPKFRATEELFDVKLFGKTPYIAGYDIKDVTEVQFAAAFDFNQAMTGRCHDSRLSDAQRVASGVSAAIACAQIGDSSRMLEMIRYLRQLDLDDYPEQSMQMRGILDSIAKDDPAPAPHKNAEDGKKN
jgi:hypothetical protein